MKVSQRQIWQQVITIFILVAGLCLGFQASAEESSLISTELMCLNELKNADSLIEFSQTDDQVVVQAAQSAIKQCLRGFAQKQNSAYLSFAVLCDKSFADIQGTTSEAMTAYCKMNAVRFALSLQLQRPK